MNTASRAREWLPNDPSRWGLGRLFTSAVSTVPGYWRATGCATSGSASGGVCLPPGGLSTNVACNSTDTVSYRASMSLELQRLWKLLKVHSVELHAKLLRARAACVPRRAREPDTSRVGPMACAWAAPPRTAASPPANGGNRTMRGPRSGSPHVEGATRRGELHQ